VSCPDCRHTNKTAEALELAIKNSRKPAEA